MDQKLIDILACPTTHRGLRPLPADKLEKLNQLIIAGQVNYVDGVKIEEALSAALITDNGAVIYRIDDDIPVLLVERGIAARQLDDY
ncbi:MAG: Trm112 family protein [Gammaproteobacteria bacterium]|nr:Trm112 family protein [Gammaproteobacteria bacterium]NNF67497.1 Trm112 family protein [Gammaproteobacteria bacterium]